MIDICLCVQARRPSNQRCAASSLSSRVRKSEEHHEKSREPPSKRTPHGSPDASRKALSSDLVRRWVIESGKSRPWYTSDGRGDPTTLRSDRPNVIVNTGAQIDHHCCIEDHAHIAPGAILCGDVTVEAGAMVGAGAVVLPGSKVTTGTLVKAASRFPPRGRLDRGLEGPRAIRRWLDSKARRVG